MDIASSIEKNPTIAIGAVVVLGVLIMGMSKQKTIPAVAEPVDQSPGAIQVDNTALNNALASLRAEMDQKLAAQQEYYQSTLYDLYYGHNTGTQIPPGGTNYPQGQD